MRKWEKQLQQIYDETDARKLTKMAEESIEKYFTSLPKHGIMKKCAIQFSCFIHVYCVHAVSCMALMFSDVY